MTQDETTNLLGKEAYTAFLNCTKRDHRVENILPHLEFIMMYADIRGLDKTALQRAMQIVFVIHDGQTRIGETQIEHVFKVTRNMAYFMFQSQKRCADTELAMDPAGETAHIIGALLHDSVEDSLKELVQFLSGDTKFFVGRDLERILSAREKAYRLITESFGDPVTQIVRIVTNPHWDKKLLSQPVRFERYKNKIQKVIEQAPLFVTLLKLSDNYVNLDFEPGSHGSDGMIRKYGPVCQSWIDFLNEPRVQRMVDDETRNNIISQYEFIEECWHESVM